MDLTESWNTTTKRTRSVHRLTSWIFTQHKYVPNFINRSGLWKIWQTHFGAFLGPQCIYLSYLCHCWKTVLEAFFIRVCPSVSECVSEFVCPENLVNTISQKPNLISPNFGRRCIWVHRYADYILRWKVSKVKVTAGGNNPKTLWTSYLRNQ